MSTDLEVGGFKLRVSENDKEVRISITRDGCHHSSILGLIKDCPRCKQEVK